MQLYKQRMALQGRERTAAARKASADSRRGETLGSKAVVAAVACLVLAMSADGYRQRQEVKRLTKLLGETERKLHDFTGMDPRADNLPFVERQQQERLARDAHETSDTFVSALFDGEGRRFPHGHNHSSWHAHLDRTTPAAFAEDPSSEEEDGSPEWCNDLREVVVTPEELAGVSLTPAVRAKALRSLVNCGYVYLDNMFPAAKVEALRQAYVAFRETDEAEQFVYPCQGAGRVEHMLPFRPPFNESDPVYADPRLLEVLGDFLQEQIKLELMTVITSPPGSRDQRWHQGWRYLFHPEERLPPYAAVVTLPLTDVTPEMGPSEMCPGKKRRFYYGWRCDSFGLRLGSTAGTVAIFDYKTLHRGPGNAAAVERPMVSMVFSKAFFLNTEAIVNRGISLVQTIHQRRYWEQFFWHPPQREEQFRV